MMIGLASKFTAWIKSKWQHWKRAISKTIIIIWIGLIAYSAWVNTLDPSGLGLLDSSSREFWTRFGPISALILVLFKPLWQAMRSDGSLRHIIVSDADKTDLKQMAKAMRNADEVTIYSGDFSYVYDYPPLYSILVELSERENLTFVSYKSKATVLARSEARRDGKTCVIATLIATGKIFFDVPGKAKFSLVYRRGEEVLLYRHREDSTDYITVFKASNGMSKQLVETVKTLVSVAIQRAKGV
jgi:hypothetical protein